MDIIISNDLLTAVPFPLSISLILIMGVVAIMAAAAFCPIILSLTLIIVDSSVNSFWIEVSDKIESNMRKILTVSIIVVTAIIFGSLIMWNVHQTEQFDKNSQTIAKTYGITEDQAGALIKNLERAEDTLPFPIGEIDLYWEYGAYAELDGEYGYKAFIREDSESFRAATVEDLSKESTVVRTLLPAQS